MTRSFHHDYEQVQLEWKTGKGKKENVMRHIQHLDQHMGIFSIFMFYRNGIKTFIFKFAF